MAWRQRALERARERGEEMAQGSQPQQRIAPHPEPPSPHAEQPRLALTAADSQMRLSMRRPVEDSSLSWRESQGRRDETLPSRASEATSQPLASSASPASAAASSAPSPQPLASQPPRPAYGPALPSSGAAAAAAAATAAEAKAQQDEINRLAASALRAKLRGDAATHAALTAQVERLRAGPKVVVLPSVDESGRPLGSKRPSQAVDAAEDSRAAGKRPAQGDARPAPAAPAAPQGAAERDEKARRDLRNLVEAERAADGADMDEYYARAVLSNESFGKLDTDAQFELAEDAMRGFDRRRAKAAARDAGDMDRRRAIAVVQRSDAVVQACPLCVESPRHQSHLVVATGLRVYLALPQRGSVCEGHCILAPVEHVLAQTQMDEDVHEELVYFQKHLAKMFAKRGKRVIFLEQTNLHGKRHCQVECVPLSEDEFAEAPMYFRKAILESDEEWAQNKRLVETNGRGIRKSVPSGFSYFFVEFGVGGDGYAHVIEDISQFPLDMGREVVCGVLGEPAQLVMHARRESRHAEVEAVRGFREMWRPFDWTIKLRKGVVQRPPKQPLPQQEQAEERAAAPLHSGSSDAGPAGGDDRG